MRLTDVIAHLVEHAPGVSDDNREEMRQAVADAAGKLEAAGLQEPLPVPEPEPAPELTPEQARIAELEAELAAAKAAAPAGG